MTFEFAAPGRILFGEGRLREVGPLAAGMGTRALVVEGGSGRAEALVEMLRENGLATVRLRVPGEPTTTLVERGLELARAERCDLVVGMGAGA